MLLVTARLKTGDVPGIVNREKTHMAALRASGFDFRDMLDLIERITPEQLRNLSEADFSAFGEVYALSETELLSPIPNPKHDIICLGVNYADHAAEFGRTAPSVPVYFGKRAAITTGHLGALDGHLDVDEFLDYEVELAVIIGKQGKKIAAEDAEEYIFGYTVFNDFTSRNLQKNHKQWFLGKSVDGFSAMGPWIVTKDELPLPLSLNLCSRVNGQLRQNSNTTLMVHGIAESISQLSQNITLYPGDIIATGTPGGVGMGFDPPLMLKSGDVVECEVENIGILKNIIE